MYAVKRTEWETAWNEASIVQYHILAFFATSHWCFQLLRKRLWYLDDTAVDGIIINISQEEMPMGAGT